MTPMNISHLNITNVLSNNTVYDIDYNCENGTNITIQNISIFT